MTINKKELQKVIKVKQVREGSQQIIINGQVHLIEKEYFTIVCPECGRVLYTFPEDVNNKQLAIKIINDKNKNLQQLYTYCPTCGQKLSFNKSFIDYKIV